MARSWKRATPKNCTLPEVLYDSAMAFDGGMTGGNYTLD